MEQCESHEKLSNNIVKLQTSFDEVKERICNHIDEGEKSGGFRDRLLVIEEAVSVLKKSYWKTAITCGIIGGLLGKVSPDIFNFLVKVAFAHNGQ